MRKLLLVLSMLAVLGTVTDALAGKGGGGNPPPSGPPGPNPPQSPRPR